MKRTVKTALVVMGLVMLLAVGCATTSASLNSIVEPNVEVIKTDVKETVASIENQIKIATEEIIEEVVSAQDFSYKYIYEYKGNEILIDAHNGYGYVTYPSFITDEEIADALTKFTNAYGDFGVTYEKVAPGSLSVQYPENLTKADFDYVAGVAAENLDWYLNQMFVTEEVTVAEPIVEQPKIEETKVETSAVVEQPKAEEAKVAAPVVAEQPKVEAPKTVETKAAVEPTVQPSVEKKGLSSIWIILIVALVVVVTLCCYFWFCKKKKSENC